MKKYLITILAVFPLMVFGQINADNVVEKFFETFTFENSLCLNTKQHDLTPVSVNLSMGVEPIKNVSVAFNWNPTLGLYNPENGNNTYLWSPDVIGGTVGYRLLGKNPEKSGRYKHALDIRASVNSTLGKHTMEFTSYEVGLYLYNRKHALSTSTVSGIGIKRINYHTPGLKDSYNIFLTLIGVRY